MNKTSYYPNRGETTVGLNGESDHRPVTRVESRFMSWLALGAIAGPLLFTLAWLILGFLSPGFTIFGTVITPYSPISAGISGLGLGVTAPWMNAAFVLNGLFIIAGSVGVFQSIRGMGWIAGWSCTLLVALTGLGSVIDGVFTIETFMPHMAGFLLAILSTILSFPIIGRLLRRIPRWHRFGSWLLLGGPLTLALTVLYFLTFSPTAAGARSGVAGLTERILVTEVLAWIGCLGWLAFRRSRVDGG